MKQSEKSIIVAECRHWL